MRTLALSVLLCLTAATPALASNHATPEATAAPSQWQTDLATHMSPIADAVDALQHYEQGHLGPAQGVALATLIEDHVRQIIDTCKLPPDQDARLHTIITPLLTNAAALKTEPKRMELIAPMRQAMQGYKTAFASVATR